MKKSEFLEKVKNWRILLALGYGVRISSTQAGELHDLLAFCKYTAPRRKKQVKK